MPQIVPKATKPCQKPEPDWKVHVDPWIRQLPDPDPAAIGSRSGSNRIWTWMLSDLIQPIRSKSGFCSNRNSIRFCRIQLWQHPDLYPVLQDRHLPHSIFYIMLLELDPAKPDQAPDVAGSSSGYGRIKLRLSWIQLRVSRIHYPVTSSSGTGFCLI